MLDYLELFEVKPTDAFFLLANDLVANYDLTTRPFLDLGSGQYTIDHYTAKTLWQTLQRAVGPLGNLPWGQRLDRMEPPSPLFREYADAILRRGVPVRRPPLPALRTPHSTSQEKIEFAATAGG